MRYSLSKLTAYSYNSISMGSSEENYLPHFRKSDVIDDVTVMSRVGDDVTCQFL